MSSFDITVKKKNDVFIQISCDPSIALELVDYFTFDVPGAKFHKLFKRKLWDGKQRLFSYKSKELYAGLVPYVKQFAKDNSYTVNIIKTEEVANPPSLEEVVKFINSLNVSLPGNETIRDYQIDAVYKAIVDKRRILLSPTSSGKSLIIYCLIRWFEQTKEKQLILVPTTSLVVQMYGDFQSYSKNNGWQAAKACSVVYSGQSKDNLNPIIISTWQSAITFPNEFFSDIDCLYGDEAHTFKAKSLVEIMSRMKSTSIRIGTTGTLDNIQVHKLVLEGTFGLTYKVITTKQLMNNNQIAQLKIMGIILQYPEDVKQAHRGFKKYPDELNFICSYEPRNKFIRDLAIAQTGNTLVLFQFVEKHGKILYDLIREKINSNRHVFFVHGSTETEQRENIRHITEKENNAIIVGSYGCMSTGVNIRNLHNIIAASPTKSKIRLLQSIGRGLRLGDNKDYCTLYDLGDDLAVQEKKNFTLIHMIERIKIYNNEQFEYKLTREHLNGV